MKIWLLAIGEYSSYEVIGVFDDEHKEEAEKIAELIGGFVEEDSLELNRYDHDEPPKGMNHYYLEMCKNGKVNSGPNKRPVLDCYGKRHLTGWDLRTHEDYTWERKSYWRLYVSMYAKSEEHIIKVANEIRVQVLAGAKTKKGNTMIDFTIVCGVDEKHLRQLSWTYPTWMKNKPSLLKYRMIVFYDHEQVTEKVIRSVVNHPDLTCIAWPPDGVCYDSLDSSKWGNAQRAKMLAGFVYVPSMYVSTAFWLKFDTDIVATENDDWIDPEWFDDGSVIVSAPWGYTKPADQILKLDAWAKEHDIAFPTPPLNLVPKEGSDLVRHPRIISWCSFYDSIFTRICARMARNSVGDYQLPVPSQDGYMWYVAERLGLKVNRVNMKRRGWQQWLTAKNIRKHSEIALGLRDGE